MSGARGRRRAGPRWTIRWSDVSAGGLGLVRLLHPLLPELAFLRPSEEGLEAGPVPPPGPLPSTGHAAYLVRLLGLSAFLEAHGLGFAPADVSALGADAAGRPLSGAAPVPAWRALSPALLAAAAAAHLGGEEVDAGAPDEVRAAVEHAALRGTPRELARAALRAEASGTPAAALLLELWSAHAPGEPLGADLLGLALPDGLLPPGDARPAAAWGPEALFLARAAARRGTRGFFESGPGALLSEGAALELLAAALGEDPRAEAISALSGGRERRVPDGSPAALVARDWERWDLRSRDAWEEELETFVRVEERRAPPAPWERRRPLELSVGVAEAAAILWLPVAGTGEAVILWERIARAAGGDLARMLSAARRAARSMEPGAPAWRLAAGARKRRPSSTLAAAAWLLDGFDTAEAALAAGVAEAEAEEALGEACIARTLVPAGPGTFRFAEESERRALASRLGAAARRSLASRTDALPGERSAAPALARGDAADVAAARAMLDRALEEGRLSLALALLGRAPEREPHLGDPLRALVAYAREGRRAQAAAVRLGDATDAPLPLRAEAARALVRLARADEALRLVPGDAGPAERLARARVLVDDRRLEAAARLLEETRGEPLDPGGRVESALLLAEIAGRAQRYAEAAAALRRAGRLMTRVAAGSLDGEAARSAGFLASDLGRTDEALAFFRRAHAEARGPEARADALADLAVTAFHAGRLEEAARHTDEALAAFAELGDRRRWVSILGNRADLLVAAGDAAGARRDLETVLAHDRAPGREHQLLFALPTLQRLALADGDLEAAARAFAEGARASGAAHPARRESLLCEAKRLLMERRPREAAALLEEARAIADNRVRNEPQLLRLAASAALDAGRGPDAGGLGETEVRLLDFERALAAGGGAPRGALDALAREPGGHLRAAERAVEWAFRFSDGFARSGALARQAAGAAARAGLAGAEALLLAAATPPAAPPAKPEEALLPAAPDGLVAEDAAMRALLAVADRVAPTALPVLILGESGTGKELVARRLHARSRRKGPFVAVNVAALTPTLVESELFGHARGAFTGADRDRAGLVEASSGGTLFLDEIGDLPLALQAKLLRVLQERELVRVGETRPRKVDLRVLSATHRPIAAMAKEGGFRFDLLQRIAGVTLEVPPLRDRPRDLAALVTRALSGARVSAEARRLLLAHAWPGNVRELLSALEAARALAGGEAIAPEHLPAALRRDATPAPRSYRAAVEEARRRIIDEALRACGGNRTHAAKRLGLSRQSLLYEIKKLGL